MFQAYSPMCVRKVVLSMATWEEGRSCELQFSWSLALSSPFSWRLLWEAIATSKTITSNFCEASSWLKKKVSVFLYATFCFQFKLEIASRSEISLVGLPSRLYSHGCQASPRRRFQNTGSVHCQYSARFSSAPLCTDLISVKSLVIWESPALCPSLVGNHFRTGRNDRSWTVSLY